MLHSANRYARAISSLDEMRIPRLLMMERILLRDQEGSQLSSEPSQEWSLDSADDGIEAEVTCP